MSQLFRPFTPFKPFKGLSLPSVLDLTLGGIDPFVYADLASGLLQKEGTTVAFDGLFDFARTSTATYVDSAGQIQTAISGAPRTDHHQWDGSTWVPAGVFDEDTSQQRLHTTGALVTQSHTLTAEPHTLHFTGTGSVTLSGAATGTLSGTGDGEENRVRLTFTPSAGVVTFTVSGAVNNAQLEVGEVATSYIPNLSGSGTVTRAADALSLPVGSLTYGDGDHLLDKGTVGSRSITILMSGTVNYADTDAGNEVEFIEWGNELTPANRVYLWLNTGFTRTGAVEFRSVTEGNTTLVVSSRTAFTPGHAEPYSIAATFSDGALYAAVNGVELTPNLSAPNLPDLRSITMDLASIFNGTISKFAIYPGDVGEAARVEATS